MFFALRKTKPRYLQCFQGVIFTMKMVSSTQQTSWYFLFYFVDILWMVLGYFKWFNMIYIYIHIHLLTQKPRNLYFKTKYLRYWELPTNSLADEETAQTRSGLSESVQARSIAWEKAIFFAFKPVLVHGKTRARSNPFKTLFKGVRNRSLSVG